MAFSSAAAKACSRATRSSPGLSWSRSFCLLELLGRVVGGLDGEADATLAAVDLDDAGGDVLADLEDVLDLVHAVLGDLRDVDEAVDVLGQPDEGAEAGELGDLAGDEVAHLEVLVDLGPGILGELLDAEADALVGLVHLEDDRLDDVALLEHLGGVVDLARPAHVGHVDHAIEAFLQLEERAVGGEVADGALDLGSGRVLLVGDVPRVGLELADAEGDLLLLAVDAEHDGLDLLALLEDVGGLGDALGPGQLGDVHEALDAGLDLDEGAVGHEVDDLALDLGPDGILLVDVVPGVGGLLLEAQGDALLLAVHVQDDDVELLADLEQLARVSKAAPGHVRDVQQAVEAVEVDEGTEVGDVLDGALADVAGHHLREQRGAAGVALGLDQLTTAEDDVLAVRVELDDAELVRVADEREEILGRDNVHLRRGAERLDADVDEEATLDDALDLAVDGAALVANGLDAIPVLLELGLLLGDVDVAILVLGTLDEDVDDVAHLHGVEILEVGGGHDALGLASDIHKDLLGPDFDDGSLDDLAGLELPVVLLEQVREGRGSCCHRTWCPASWRPR